MDTPEPTPESTTHLREPAASRPLVPIVLAAGLLAGVASSLAGEAIYSAYGPRIFPLFSMRPKIAEIDRQITAVFACASVTFATLGGLLGLALGLAGGLVRRSRSQALRGAVVGLVLGGGLGGLTTRIIMPIYYQRKDPDAMDIMLPLLTHGLIWVSSGLVAGGVLGGSLGPGRWKSATAGGVVGALLATLAYEVGGAIAFPTARTDLALAATVAPRVLAHLLVTLGVTTGALLAVRSIPVPPPPPVKPT